MAEKENIMLSDKQLIPEDEYIFKIIGDKKIIWQTIMEHMRGTYKDSAGVWNYYNDGKRWLFKMQFRKKTIFWIAILEDTFRVTFWFGDKAEKVIEESDLAGNIKNEFKTAKKYGAIRAVSITIHEAADIENVIKLAALKVKLK